MLANDYVSIFLNCGDDEVWREATIDVWGKTLNEWVAAAAVFRTRNNNLISLGYGLPVRYRYFFPKRPGFPKALNRQPKTNEEHYDLETLEQIAVCKVVD